MTTLESLDQRLTVLEERSNLQTALERHTTALFGDLAQLITGLAKSQQDGFANVHRRIDTLDERMARIENKLDRFID